MLSITIDGCPIAKMRHRYAMRQGHLQSYDPQAETKEQVRNAMSVLLHKAIRHADPKIAKDASNLAYSESFEVGLYFYLPTPKSSSCAKRNALAWVGTPTGKPDLDNLAKFYLDCANGIFWGDDAKITSLTATKCYSQNPKTVINISGRQNMSLHSTAEGILGIFSPQDFESFTRDVEEGYANFVALLTQSNGKDPGDIRSISAGASALLLSLIADKYADKLSKIRKKYPNWHQEWTDIEANCKAYSRTNK